MTDWWHVVKSTANFGRDRVQAVWAEERSSGVVTAGYGNAPNGLGRAKLLRCRPLDRVFAYIPEFGAVGVGDVVAAEPEYREVGSRDDHAHLLAVRWIATVERPSEAIAPAEIKRLGGYVPRTLAMRMGPSVARGIEALLRKAAAGQDDC